RCAADPGAGVRLARQGGVGRGRATLALQSRRDGSRSFWRRRLSWRFPPLRLVALRLGPYSLRGLSLLRWRQLYSGPWGLRQAIRCGFFGWLSSVLPFGFLLFFFVNKFPRLCRG